MKEKKKGKGRPSVDDTETKIRRLGGKQYDCLEE